MISPNPQYIEEAKKWIERLDSGGGEGVRFYVYNLQNQRAERVAPLLQQAFTGRTTQPTAPGRRRSRRARRPGTIVSPPAFQTQPTIAPNTPAQRRAAAAAAAAAAAPRSAPRPARQRSAATASASCATSRSSPTRTRTRS